MIDNQVRTMALIEKLKAALPINALPTEQLIAGLKEKSNIEITPGQIMEIESVMYLGDVGGIACAIKWQEGQDSAVITSITHLKVSYPHSLAKDIKDYQDRRIKKLSKIR